MKKKIILAFVCSFSLFLLLFSKINVNLQQNQEDLLNQPTQEEIRKDYLENEWLVKVESQEEAMNIALSNGLVLKSVSKYGIALFYGYQSPISLLKHGQDNPDFQPNYLYYTQEVIIDDPGAPQQFALDHLDAYLAWQYSLGEDVLVAIIDTGIDYNHDEFTTNISALSYNSAHQVVGYEAVNDDVGHGTMVAGVIAATQNNGIGISGIAPAAELLVIKANVDNEGYFSTSAIADGIYYAVDNGAHIINMSLGGAYPDSIMETACDYALSQGVIVVAAAGNDGLPILNYPASYSSVISVGATTNTKEKASFSNFNSEVDISAPGEAILTTVPGNTYGTVSGTSFSSPYIAGVIALLLSYYDTETIDMVLNYLYASADDLGTFGKDSFYGVGLANAHDGLTITLRKVTLETFLGSPLPDKYVAEGRNFFISDRPTLEGHYFAGWYKDETLLERFDFENEVIYEDITLYAKYEEGESTYPDDYDFLINIDDTITILSYFGPGGEVIVPNEIYGLPVVEISSGAFIFNQNITSLTIPDSVTEIGDFAFAYMTAIETITIGTGLETMGIALFLGDSTLATVEIQSENLTYLAEHTFTSATNLSSVTLPNSITVIQRSAFENTFSLHNFVFPSNLETIADYAFYNSGITALNLPNSLKAIYSYAFGMAAYITEVNFGAELISIGQGAFIGCAFVENITLNVNNTHFTIINEVLYTADQKALVWYFPYNTNNIYTMPQEIEYIFEGAFSNAKFTNIYLNETITHIPNQAFYEALELKEIIIPDNVKTMGEYVFQRAYGLTTVVLPKDLEKLPNGTFDRNIALKNVTFPENLRIIGGAAFVASGVEKIILPETVEIIEGWGFIGCVLLKEIYIPDGVRIVGAHALSTVDLEEMLPNLEIIGDTAFDVTSMEEIIFPESATQIDCIRMSGLYDITRKIDFGSAKEVLLVASWGSRLQEIVINEVTEKVIIEGESLFTPHIYVYGMTTELEILFSTSGYVVHAHEGSVAHAYALNNGFDFVDLDRTVELHNIVFNINGPATLLESPPAQFQDQELFHFELDVLEGNMVYEIKVNGQYIVNHGRSYWVRVLEDLVIDIQIRPITDVLEDQHMVIIDQIIVSTSTNAEYVNYPSSDEFDNPILGFNESNEFLTIIADNMYDVRPHLTYYHSNDIIHLSFPKFVTHIPLLNHQFRYLKSIDVHEGVLTMDGFEELQELEYVILPSTLTKFPQMIFDEIYVRGSFSYCDSLKAVVFKSELITEIPSGAFFANPALKYIYLSTEIEFIGEYAFYNAISFEELILNNPLVQIASTAFMFKDYGYYYIGFSPLGDEFSKLPNLVLSSTQTAVIDYASNMFIDIEIADKYYLAYLNQEVLEIFIETVRNGEDGTFAGEFTKSPFLMTMYLFVGWDKSRIDITDNLYTYPIFAETLREFEVKFIDPYTKEIIGTDYVLYGEAATAPINTERAANPKYTYLFTGWNQDFTNVQKDLVVEAIYERTLVEYQVVFYDWEGEVLDTQSVGYGLSATEPYLPDKPLHVFKAWSDDFTYVVKDIDVYPIREANLVTVFFYNFYGNEIYRTDVYEGDSVTPPVAEEIGGYIFIGWSEDLAVVYTELHVYPIYAQTESVLTLIYNDIEQVNIIAIAGGQYSSLILDDQNRLYGVGSNNFGMLGSDQFNQTNYPIDVTAAYNLNPGELIVKIYLGHTNSIILTSEGRVFAAGSNTEGQLGIGSSGSSANYPTDITANFNFNPDETLIYVTIGETHILALSNQGRLFAWGQNSYGQLGTGDTVSRTLPTDVTASFTLAVGETIEHVGAGQLYSGVFTSLGKLYLWGFNQGQLADNTFDHHEQPNDITANFALNPGEFLTTVKLHDGYGFALTSEHRIFAWGGGYNGNLSTGGISNFPLPTDVTSNFNLQTGEFVEEIILGFAHGYALTSNNRLLGWGYGAYGTLANGNRKDYNPVLDITGYFNLGEDSITMVKTANYNGFVQTSSGKLYGFGMNNYGQVGVYSNRDILNPTLMTFNNFDVGQYLYSYGDEIILPTLSQDTHNFLGWFYDYDFTQPVEVDFELTQDTILYPHWEIKTYTVRFLDDDGTVLKEEIVEHGADATPPENPFKEATAEFTYTFIGWDESYNYITQDLDIRATYYADLNYYTVTFFNADGSEIKSEHLPYGESATPPEEPTKMPTAQYSYIFSGWSEDYSFIESNLNIYPIFVEVINEYKVSFFDEDGTLLKEEMVPYGEGATPPEEPTKLGDAQYSYIFTGWVGEYDFVTQELFIFASYLEVINQYSIKFYDHNGVMIKEEMVPYGSSATAPVAPEKPSDGVYEYQFLYWSEDFSFIIGPLDIYPIYSQTPITYVYSLAPGVDTIYQDSDWIDAGMDYDNPNISYYVIGEVDTSEIGSYLIVYVLEVNGNPIAEVKRVVRVIEKPRDPVIITLNPGISTLFIGDAYVEAGATSSEGTVVVIGNVDTSKAGFYIIEYQVVIGDNTYSKYRYVIVYNAGMDLTNINAIIPQVYGKEDEE